MFCWHAKMDSKLANINSYEYVRTVEIKSIFTIDRWENRDRKSISVKLSLSFHLSIAKINLTSTHNKTNRSFYCNSYQLAICLIWHKDNKMNKVWGTSFERWHNLYSPNKIALAEQGVLRICICDDSGDLSSANIKINLFWIWSFDISAWSAHSSTAIRGIQTQNNLF